MNETYIFQYHKSKFWIGIALFIVQSIAIYTFCNVLLDIVRLSCCDDPEFFILSNMERYYFNLIFAYFGLISGFHVFLKWIVKPPIGFNIHKTVHNRNNWRDHFYYSEVLFYVLFALIIFYGKIYFVLPRMFLDVSPKGYLWLFPFFVLLVYFLSIFLIFSKRRIKFRLLFILSSFIVISIGSFGIANFNVVNYKKWDTKFLEKNPQRKCHFEIIKSNIYDDNYFGKYFELIPIYFYINDKGFEEIIFDKKIMDLNQLNSAIQNFNLKHNTDSESAPLFIDKKIKWEQFDQLRKILCDNQIKSIQYFIDDPEQIHPFEENCAKVIKYRIFDYLYKPLMKEQWNNTELAKISNIIQVNLIDNNSYQINGSVISNALLKSTIKNLIFKDTNYIIIYNFHKNIDFGTYFNLFIKAKEALFEINNNQVIDPKNSELFLYSKNERAIPFLIIEEVK
jgi:hypothetical protein